MFINGFLSFFLFGIENAKNACRVKLYLKT